MQFQGSTQNNLILAPRGRFWLPGPGSSPGDPGRLSPFPLQPKIANHRQGWAKGGDGVPTGNALHLPSVSRQRSRCRSVFICLASRPPPPPPPPHAWVPGPRQKHNCQQSFSIPCICSGSHLNIRPPPQEGAGGRERAGMNRRGGGRG